MNRRHVLTSVGASALAVAATTPAAAIEWLDYPERGSGGLPGAGWDGDGSAAWAASMGTLGQMSPPMPDGTPEAQVLAQLRASSTREIEAALVATFADLQRRYDLPRNIRWYVTPEDPDDQELYLVKQQQRGRTRPERVDINELTAGWVENDLPWDAIGVWALRNFDHLWHEQEIDRVAWAFNLRMRAAHTPEAPSRMQMKRITTSGRHYLVIRNQRGVADASFLDGGEAE